MSQDTLRNQHSDGASRFARLRLSAVTQISELLESHYITLGVPIESRVKTWASIEEKIQRKGIVLKDIRDLHDLVGIRIILLFRSDLETVIRLLKENFEVISSEDTGERLGDAQFGYQSQHIVVKIPKAWLQVPSFSALGDLHLELQVRTLAQHIWAAASHKLQYKNEESVPPPIRRAINRASALLETVDLEFERVLDERRSYIESSPEMREPDSPLNVDSIALVLSEELPEDNKKEGEPYSDLLTNLTALSVTTAPQLRAILRKHKSYILKREATEVANRLDKSDDAGAFFSHVGLTRTALRKEFGSAKVGKLIDATRAIRTRNQ
jgi:putative GTP pyrophosphokinase